MAFERKRIFVISPYPIYPVADGCARRIDGISRLLVANGCEVFLFVPRGKESGKSKFRPDGDIQLIPYSRKRKYNYFINFDLSRTLKKHLAEKPDLIILSFPYLSKAVYPLARNHKIPVHLDAHNIEHQRFKNMGRSLVSMLIYFFERYAVKKASSVSVTSEIDADTFKKKFARESTVIENFIDTERFFPIKKEEKSELKRSLGLNFPKIVSYFGNFSNRSTRQAYEIICGDIAPRIMLIDPRVKIVVVGKGLKKGKPPVENMVIVGEVERIERYIQVSDMVIVPLVSGGGTRYRILEALGCGIPVLSTPKGNEGLDLKPEDGVILSDVKEFPEKIAGFFTDEAASVRFHPRLEKILGKYSLSEITRKIDCQKAFGLTGKKPL